MSLKRISHGLEKHIGGGLAPVCGDWLGRRTLYGAAIAAIFFHDLRPCDCHFPRNRSRNDPCTGLGIGSCSVSAWRESSATSSSIGQSCCDRRALAESKRDGVGGPPGFSGAVIFDRNATPAPSLAGSGIAPSGSISSGLAAVPGSLPATFRERERLALRSSAKADLVGDQAHGTSGPSKSGRSAHANAGPLEARQLGRRPEVNVRRHDPSGAQKHAAEQAKRASVNRAQTSGAPGNYRSFDSLHNNFLVPVIPLQFAVKP